jgi:hypothetical protein
MSQPTDYSRGLRLAGTAAQTDQVALRDRLEATHVHITADSDVPGIPQALVVLVADLRRIPLRLSIDQRGTSIRLPDPLMTVLEETADGIDPERSLFMGAAQESALHIHLGAHPPTTATISAVPDGHGVHLRRRGCSYPHLTASGTGLGAVLTAATLTAEVFKAVTGLRPGTYQELPILDFCPVTLGNNPGAFAPALPQIEDTALIGAGAIGTGIALILKLLAATGTLTITDPECFEPPNVTTYSLGTRRDAEARRNKVDLIAEYLPAIDIFKMYGTAQDLIDEIDQGTAPWPRRVLGALDSIQARHEIQRLHADLTLDGSTGGQAGTTLALHEAVAHGPCLRCYYPSPAQSVSAEQLLHQTTGLPLERIARGDEPLIAADLAALIPAQQAALKPYLGKPVCGLGRLSALTGQKDDFRPSAAFVAQQAACLVVGALIARTTGHISGPMRRAEYDTRFGPRLDMIDIRRPRATCMCQVDAPLISEIRSYRTRAPAGLRADQR